LQTITAILGGLLAHVDADRRGDQLRKRELVGRHAVTRKVNRCIEMRAAVFWRAESIRRVEVPARGLAIRQSFELEPRRRTGRPVQRLLAIRMTEVNHTKTGQVERVGLYRQRGQEDRKQRRLVPGVHDRASFN
jgi:hypothetical protein